MTRTTVSDGDGYRCSPYPEGSCAGLSDDCAKHAIDWRAETLRLRATIAILTERSEGWERLAQERTMQLAKLKDAAFMCDGPVVKGSGGHRVHAWCGESAQWHSPDYEYYCDTHLPAEDRKFAIRIQRTPERLAAMEDVVGAARSVNADFAGWTSSDGEEPSSLRALRTALSALDGEGA